MPESDNLNALPKVLDEDSIIEDCSALIVGKKASATGEMLLGHNEDDPSNSVMIQYKVPRATHAVGEVLTFEPECAKIPQVPETWAYYWSETRAGWKAPFSDVFMNECGVSISSNSCVYSREDNPEYTNGGIGYGLGHVIAQRAKTAREGVRIAAEMVSKYGYTGSGRAYEIVDKNEGWMFQVAQGKHYAARRVPDDEVLFIPNWFTIRNVDVNDKDNYVVAPDLITYAEQRGWYTPAKAGDYSDFDFAIAYQNPTQNMAGNSMRHKNALRILLGSEPEDIRPFSVKPAKKIGVEDIKKLLRTHYEGTEDDKTNGYSVNPHRSGVRTICAGTTIESIIVQFREEVPLTLMWRAALNPCTSPYVPWYLGATAVPEGYGWIVPANALKNHFDVPVQDLTYRPTRAWWAFQSVQDMADMSYKSVIGKIAKTRDALEQKWAGEQAKIEAVASETYKKDPAKAAEMLTEYTNEQAKLAWRAWREMFNVLQQDDYAQARLAYMALVEDTPDLGNHGQITWSRDESHKRK